MPPLDIEDLEAFAAAGPEKAERRRKARAEDDGDGVLLTEHCVAKAFADRDLDRLRYCHSTGAWFIWTGTHWQRDGRHTAFSWARDFIAATNRTEELKVQAITGKAAFAGGVERFARADQRLAVTAEAWNPDPWLLGTPGGTVDLRTGELRPARPEDMISRMAAVAPSGQHPGGWLTFMEQATAGDTALVLFLQRWCGYCLTGSTREQKLMFVHGPGGNGKSVFLNVLSGILGAYAETAAMDTFVASHTDKHPTDVAGLAGARLVTASETEEGRAWAETRINSLTGGDVVKARFMRQDFFSFKPQFKLTFAGNHKPVLKNVGDAARRRFLIVPFLHKPPRPDPRLEERLKAEWPGILRWMIEGCVAWQRDGLAVPEVVADATAEYFEDQDWFSRWLEECAILDPSLSAKPADLHRSIKDWCEANGLLAPDGQKVAAMVERTPGLRKAKVHGDRRTKGIGLKPPEGRGAKWDDL